MVFVRQPLPLSNTQDDHFTLVDTLHSKTPEAAINKCTNSVCNGSVMGRDGTTRPTTTSAKDETWAEAVTFLQAFYDTQKDKDAEDECVERMSEVYQQIVDTGTYRQTTEELEYGVKTAWRNASRCIGRIQWSKLKLFDMRNVKSSDEMFEAICTHIEYSTNGGNIRSGITVFKPSESGETPCRIWNQQYIAYAGYEQPDGSVLGDPINADFTKICLKLGWKSKRTSHDILPLVLQYGPESPKFYDIPDDLVMKVNIRHSRYPGLAKLNLQWYAVPAVCGMYMDCGGLIYPAVGFNGWYMSTEIMRDLCDTGRYNMLKDIAEAMGYDTEKPSFYWKDTVAAELNVAIVQSYQDDGVTIVDHHTASESFIRHMANETKARGGCPADWVWISPPIGGSLTQVFHQEMLNYQLKPAFCYQKAAVMNRCPMSGRRRQLSFKCVARCVLKLAAFMKRAMSKRVPCTILYASETGTSEQCAYKLQKMFDKAFNVRVCSMDEYDLKLSPLTLAVVSTFGNGEAPENGRKFLREMSSTVNNNILKDFRYAIFGLGSSAYITYCAFAKAIDKYLCDVGMEQVLPLHTGDAMKNQESSFRQWSKEVFNACTQKFKIRLDVTSDASDSSDQDKLDSLLLQRADREIPLCDGLRKIHKKDVAECSLLSLDILSCSGSRKEYLKVSLENPNGFNYQPGDHVAIFPINSERDVDIMCERLVDTDEATTANTPVTLVNQSNDWAVDIDMPTCSMRTALTYYLDISGPPHQNLLQRLVERGCVKDMSEEKDLTELATDESLYNNYIATERPSLVTLIRKFQSVEFTSKFLLSECQKLKPRFYSVSSTPDVSSTRIDLTVALHTFEAKRDGQNVHRGGLCSSWLRRLEHGDTVRMYIKRSPGFKMPRDKHTPMILVGPGSGVAPFRGFWQHRQVNAEASYGPMVLFFGCWGPEEQIYQDEMERAVSDGVMTSYEVAYSRRADSPKMYVQDDIWRKRKYVLNLIVNKGAHFYVCGDVKMANDVCLTINKMASKIPNLPTDLISVLKGEGRYHEDIYGTAVPTVKLDSP